eukprot:PhM_4_TR6233/c0_g1_i1/m.37453
MHSFALVVLVWASLINIGLITVFHLLPPDIIVQEWKNTHTSFQDTVATERIVASTVEKHIQTLNSQCTALRQRMKNQKEFGEGQSSSQKPINDHVFVEVSPFSGEHVTDIESELTSYGTHIQRSILETQSELSALESALVEISENLQTVPDKFKRIEAQWGDWFERDDVLSVSGTTTWKGKIPRSKFADDAVTHPNTKKGVEAWNKHRHA